MDVRIKKFKKKELYKCFSYLHIYKFSFGKRIILLTAKKLASSTISYYVFINTLDVYSKIDLTNIDGKIFIKVGVYKD